MQNETAKTIVTIIMIAGSVVTTWYAKDLAPSACDPGDRYEYRKVDDQTVEVTHTKCSIDVNDETITGINEALTALQDRKNNPNEPELMNIDPLINKFQNDLLGAASVGISTSTQN